MRLIKTFRTIHELASDVLDSLEDKSFGWLTNAENESFLLLTKAKIEKYDNCQKRLDAAFEEDFVGAEALYAVRECNDTQVEIYLGQLIRSLINKDKQGYKESLRMLHSHIDF